jgi:fatty-acyl-CoA synthase
MDRQRREYTPAFRARLQPGPFRTTLGTGVAGGLAMYTVPLRDAYFPAQPGVVQEVTLGGVLRRAMQEAPDAEALVEIGMDAAPLRRWTRHELLDEAIALALALLTRYRPGERVAVWAPNLPEWVLLEFATALAGLVLVTVNPSYQARELAFVLGQSRSAGLFLVPSFRGNPMAETARAVCAGLPAIREIVDVRDGAAMHATGPFTPALPVVAPGDPVQVQYTSGTTGFPKGAVLTHRNLANNARFSFERFGMAHGDTFLNMMPLFHTAGCSLGVLGSLQCGARVLMPPMFEPAAMLRAVEEQGVTQFIAVPTMLAAMLASHEAQPRDTATLRAVMAGGSMVPPPLVARIQDAFGCDFTIIYGQTETSPGITQTHGSDDWTQRTQTIGQPFPCTEVSIRGVADNAVQPFDAVGEICVRGYCVMQGYNDQPEATAKTIDAGGWLHTGDLGTMDAQGFVRVTGRVKDMIIRGGENIFPAEIENVLVAHPGVAEVAVVGVPDDYWGEVAVAFVRARADAALRAADLVRHVRAELAAPKTPARWFALEAFPLTGSGKVQKFALRDRYLAGEFTANELD